MIPPLAVDEDTTEPSKPRGTWVRLTTRDAKRITGNILEKFNLGIGASAALTVGLVYFVMFLFFTIGFVLTVPRSDTQVYNITITTEDYQAYMKIITDLSLQPLQVNMSCTSNRTGESLIYLFLTQERLVLYKDKLRNRCYVRSTSGGQFQKEIKTFKNLILGRNVIDPQPTVHYLLQPTSLSPQDQQYLLGHDEIHFCSGQDIYWINYMSSHIDQEKRKKKNSQHHSMSYNACLQTLIIHSQNKLKS